MTPPFRKVLIANRGEIAVRIARTLQRLGVASATTCHNLDAHSPAARAADEVLPLEGADPIAAYLDVEQIIHGARRLGAEAIHPGYGFLSENAAFARRCAEAGITFVGPPAAAIDAMGDKVESKRIAEQAGVSVIPGFNGVVESAEHAVAVAEDIGYPVRNAASSFCTHTSRRWRAGGASPLPHKSTPSPRPL